MQKLNYIWIGRHVWQGSCMFTVNSYGIVKLLLSRGHTFLLIYRRFSKILKENNAVQSEILKAAATTNAVDFYTAIHYSMKNLYKNLFDHGK